MRREREGKLLKGETDSAGEGSIVQEYRRVCGDSTVELRGRVQQEGGREGGREREREAVSSGEF